MNRFELERRVHSESLYERFKRHGGVEWTIAISLLVIAFYGFYWLLVLLVEITK